MATDWDDCLFILRLIILLQVVNQIVVNRERYRNLSGEEKNKKHQYS